MSLELSPVAAAGVPPEGGLDEEDSLLRRWRAAAERLGLAPAAGAAGAALIAEELGAGRPSLPTRGALIAIVAERYGSAAALQGVLELEGRGVVAALRSSGAAWRDQPIELSPAVRAYCAGVSPAPRRGSSPFTSVRRVEAALARLIARSSAHPKGFLLVLRGARGSGRDAALAHVLERLGLEARERGVVELRSESDGLEPELSGAAAVWDARRCDPGPDDYALARRWLARSPSVAFVLADSHQDIPDVPDRVALRVELDLVSREERADAWLFALASLPLLEARRRDLANLLSARTRAGIGFAYRAVAACRDLELDRMEDLAIELEAALEDQVQPSAQRGIAVERPRSSASVVVAGSPVLEALTRLHFLCEHHGAASDLRRGVAALFAGPSGTGKTLAARELASRLRRPLYRVDLASVVSKWIGETERNLRDALGAAEAAGAVLLFDEGDALFGKRGEIARGSDRYANLEVSYLLQALEAHDGITVVTTNLRSNIDEAFTRRFDSIVEFAPPDPRQRLAIWKQELGDGTASLSERELAELARTADLHGGSIASAARLARVLSRRRGDALLQMNDIHSAVEAEFLKMGSSVQASSWKRRSS